FLGHTQGSQEDVQRFARRERFCALGEALEVDVKLPVRIFLTEPVGRMGRKRGFTDPAHPCDHDAGGEPCPTTEFELLEELSKLHVTPLKTRRCRGELVHLLTVLGSGEGPLRSPR